MMKTNDTSNRKQFKEFSPELFKAYIDKFSAEDKIKAMKVLDDSIKKREIFFIGNNVKVVKDGCNASDFHNNGRGIYNIADWANTVFEIAGDYEDVEFVHNPKCYGAYPLRLVGGSEVLGYVYSIAIEKIH